MRQPHNGDVELSRASLAVNDPPLVEHHRILVGNPNVTVVGEDTQGGDAGPLLQEVQGRSEQGHIAAKLVDNETAHQCPLVRLQQLHRSDERRQDTAPVNVANQQDRRLGIASDAHVHDVAFPQVDLGRAARALDHDNVVGGAQCIEALGDDVPPLGIAARILCGILGTDRPAQEHNLAATTGLGFEQDGIHLDGRCFAGRRGLYGLRAANLAAVGRSEGVERHILGFERCHAIARLPEQSA